MAGDWIKVDAVLPEKPEVWLLAERLDLDPDAVVGKLIRLWAWLDQHMGSEGAIFATPKQIDSVCRCEKFSTALVDVGWLLIHKRSGTVSVPKWDRHNGKSAKDRALTRERMKRSRDAVSVTSTSQVRHQRREEKRKEEEKKKPRPASPPADRRDGGARLGAAPPTPSAGDPVTASPGPRRDGMARLSTMLRQVHPPDQSIDAIRDALEARKPIPIPTEEDEHVQTAQA